MTDEPSPPESESSSETDWKDSSLSGPWELFGGLYSAESVKKQRSLAPEVALWGRSNVGKSTLLNVLIQHGKLARTGRTPGVTKALMIYGPSRLAQTTSDSLQRRAPTPTPSICLVDLPGYGYARLGGQQRQEIRDLTRSYLRHRRALWEIWLLIDAMVGPKSSDQESMQTLVELGIPTRIILTKCDRAKEQILQDTQQKTPKAAEESGLILRGIHRWGATRKLGLDNLRSVLLQIATPHEERSC